MERYNRWICRVYLLSRHHNHNLDLGVVMAFRLETSSITKCRYYFTHSLSEIRLQVLEKERSCEHDAPNNLTFTLPYFKVVGGTATVAIPLCDNRGIESIT